MNVISSQQSGSKNLESLQKLTSLIYLCQLLSLILAGLPLLVGVAINLYKRDEVQGTWLESHFDWQIKTAWITLLGAVLSGMSYSLDMGRLMLIVTLCWLIYRITIGWYVLNDDQPMTIQSK